MKKNSLTTAVFAGLAGVAGIGSIANADITLNPDGLGQVLIYPYYTVQAGNETAISVVNTTNQTKAVKVRFLEGRNSREVLDFNLYLSEFDVWTATVFAIPANLVGGPAGGILTTDRSCTTPDIVRGGFGFIPGDRLAQLPDGRYYVPFVNFAYVGGGVAADGPLGLERTREGYVEMIEMGTLPAPWSTNARHGATGEPSNCLAFSNEWFVNNGANIAPATLPASGGLFGNSFIVKPANGTLLSTAADAIDGFLNVCDATGCVSTALHTDPGNILPNLGNAGGASATARSVVFNNGQLIRSTYTNIGNDPLGTPRSNQGKVDAISSLYATPRVINEYYLESGGVVTGQSEWVINFPTKRFYVDFRPTISGASFVSPVPAGGAGYPPFANAFNNGSCQPVTITLYNREERTTNVGNFSPSPPQGRSLCWEAQVITFRQTLGAAGSAILGSTYALNIAPPADFRHGWASVGFDTFMRASIEGNRFRGVPATGFFAFNYDNANAASGTLANYSGLFRHRTERSCVNVGTGGTGQGVCS